MLPNNESPYVQCTNHIDGIELEDWTAYIVACGDKPINGSENTTLGTDVTDYFMVEDVFQNVGGYSQFTWSLTNVPFDFGHKMCYLMVTQTLGETFYSNRFKLTQEESEKVTRVDYRNSKIDTMQSVGLNMWYVQPLKNQEISAYYERSTGNTVINSIKSQKYESWKTRTISNDLFIKISDMFESVYIYVDQYRCNLFENLEVTKHSGQRNSEENELFLTFNRNDFYDPKTASETEPVIVVPEITLSNVTANGFNAIYTFSYSGFEPSELTFVYYDNENSPLDGNYITETIGTTEDVGISFTETGTWFFQIKHPEAESNIIELDLAFEVEAIDDNRSVLKGNSINISVMDNDTVNPNTLITGVSSPSYGTVEIIDNGANVRYTHNDSDFNLDSFTYTISDGQTSDTASVYISVTQPVSSKSVFMSSSGDKTKSVSCLLNLGVRRYFEAEGLYLILGDTLYTDTELTTPFNGNNLYYSIENGKTVKVNNSGVITDISLC